MNEFRAGQALTDAAPAKRRTARLLSYALFIASPFLLLGVLSLIMGRNAFDSYPVWSNELSYWRTLFSWLNVGLDTGYNGMYEVIPQVGQLGTSGLAPLLLYGWFVKLFGLSGNSILLCNAVWISLAALVFCALEKPKTVVSLIFSALILCYAPIVLYCVTSMTALFNYALILFFLAFLFRYQHKRSAWALTLCVITVALGCAYRSTYFLLFLPLIAVYSHFRFGWRLVVSFALSAAIWLGCCLLAARYSAPLSQGFVYHLVRAENAGLFIKMLLSHLKKNLVDFFSPSEILMIDMFRWMYCAAALLCLARTFLRVRFKARKLDVRVRFSGETLCCFLVLIGALGIVATLYETNDWNDYRYLAPLLWLVLGYLALRGKYAIPAAALVACAVTLVVLAANPPVGAYSDPYRFVHPPKDANLTQVIQAIPYEPNVDDPFVNTVRLDIGGLQAAEELHPGLGMQTGWFTTDTTGKSNWILTDHLKCVVEGYEPVMELPQVKLYKLTRP